MTTTPFEPGRTCLTCAHGDTPMGQSPCNACVRSARPGGGMFPDWEPADTLVTAAVASVGRDVHLPEDETRNSLVMATGLLDYFPNALAEVARLSNKATEQHHPDAEMHWDRSKSTDHPNKIVRHLIDRGKRDDRGERHSAMLAWRALANLQEEMERDMGLPPSRASRNRPF